MDSIKDLLKKRDYKKAAELARDDLVKRNEVYFDGWGWMKNSEANFLLNSGFFRMKGDTLQIVCKDYVVNDRGDKVASPEWTKNFNAFMGAYQAKKKKNDKADYVAERIVKEYSKEIDASEKNIDNIKIGSQKKDS